MVSSLIRFFMAKKKPKPTKLSDEWPRDRRVSVSITEVEYQLAKEQAEKTNTSVSEVIQKGFSKSIEFDAKLSFRHYEITKALLNPPSNE